MKDLTGLGDLSGLIHETMRITFLGTGAAEGIPAINCDCAHCRRARVEGGKLARERGAILFSLPGYELLVDTPPGISDLLAKHNVKRVDGIYLTHAHYDHSAGLGDLLYWRQDVDLFATPSVYDAVKREYWDGQLSQVAFYMPTYPGLAIRLDGLFFVPFEVHHSAPTFGLACYVKNRRVVYTSDTDIRISRYALCLMRQADLLIANTPRPSPPHEAHITVEEAIALKSRVEAQRLILTHLNHNNRPHDVLAAYVQQFPDVIAAHDGMSVDL